MNDISISIWQAIIATAGGVVLAVVVPLLVAFLAFKTWMKNAIKLELADFQGDLTKQVKDLENRLERIGPIERYIEQQAHTLKDKPNPPVTRKNELLDKWHSQSMTYPESLELKGILEQESQNADQATKALIALVLIGLGLYLLTHD